MQMPWGEVTGGGRRRGGILTLSIKSAGEAGRVLAAMEDTSPGTSASGNFLTLSLIIVEAAPDS